MTAQHPQYGSYVDFYEAQYGSVIQRVTPLSFATLMQMEQSAGDWSDLPTPDLVIARIARGQRTFSADIGAGRFGGPLESNQTLLFAPHTHTSIQVAGRHSLEVVALPFAQLKVVVGDDLRLPEDGDFGALHTKWLADPSFGHMIGAMFDVADPNDPAARLFFDSTLIALTARLVMASCRTVPKPVRRGGLADWQVKRATEVLSGAYGNFDLAALSDSVGLSPCHFSRAFKQATGLPPHRYQIMLRIDRAKELLAGSPLSIADVAAAVGYDDQGQLARLFRREVGITPSQYRRERRK